MEYLDMRKMSVNLWRNTAGETREICTSSPAKCDLHWRVSITSTAADREFSLFPDMERIVTLLEGGEMFLESADRFNHTLKPLQPFSFTADLMVKAKLTAGQMLMDFNTMTRLDACKVRVRIAERTFTTLGSRGGVVFVINGARQLGDKLLTTDQSACWFDDRYTLRLLQLQGKLLFSEINWLAGHSSDQVQQFHSYRKAAAYKELYNRRDQTRRVSESTLSLLSANQSPPVTASFE